MIDLVLIVDDDVDLALLLARHAQRLGCAARTFPTATDARAFLASTDEPVAAICVDLTLPDGSGFDLCAALKSDPRHGDVPVLILSGRSGLDEEARALEVGAVGFLQKPFRTQAFLDRLRPLLGSERSLVSEVNG